MKTKGEKKEQIREQIVEASRVYRDKLAGKVFLYVVGGEWFEVVFQTKLCKDCLKYVICKIIIFIPENFDYPRPLQCRNVVEGNFCPLVQLRVSFLHAKHGII